MKYCLDCGRQFLNEKVHPELRGESEGDPALDTQILDTCISPQEDSSQRFASRKLYFVDYLFEKFDTCPYCGGKFCTNA